MDIKSEIASNQTVLLLMSNTEYNEVLVKTLKGLSGNICYVTTNKTYDALKEIFEKNKVNLDNVVFIDAISKTIKKVPDQAENVYYVSSPGALTELDLAVGKFLGHEFDYLIFDSLTNLSIYNKMPICSKFVKSLISKINRTKTKAIFYALGSQNDDFATKAAMFVDKVVESGGKSNVAVEKKDNPSKVKT